MEAGCRVSKVTLKASGTEIYILPKSERSESAIREAMIEGLEIIDEYGEPQALMSIMIWPDGTYSTIRRVSEGTPDNMINGRTMMQMLDELKFDIAHDRSHSLI